MRRYMPPAAADLLSRVLATDDLDLIPLISFSKQEIRLGMSLDDVASLLRRKIAGARKQREMRS